AMTWPKAAASPRTWSTPMFSPTMPRMPETETTHLRGRGMEGSRVARPGLSSSAGNPVPPPCLARTGVFRPPPSGLEPPAMPQLDLPLDKLRTYEGRNPRPADFDAYWARALAELDAIAPEPRTSPAPFAFPGVVAEHLTFTGVGGARIHAKLLRPAQAAGRRPAICLFHGYTGSSGDWLDKLAWVAQGYVVAALDCRGQGGLSEDNGQIKGNTHHGHIIRGLDDHPDKLLFRSIYLDTAQLARVILARDDVDPARVHAHGGSQGGALTIACAALEPRIRKAAPVFPFLCDYL